MVDGDVHDDANIVSQNVNQLKKQLNGSKLNVKKKI